VCALIIISAFALLDGEGIVVPPVLLLFAAIAVIWPKSKLKELTGVLLNLP
jgi:hypothetical protein